MKVVVDVQTVEAIALLSGMATATLGANMPIIREMGAIIAVSTVAREPLAQLVRRTKMILENRFGSPKV